MEYTIRQLAGLAGVSTRTLRWYDRLGLLRPSRIGENGYRYYGGAEVDRLQQIMFYRALGVELVRIKAILDDPSFDRLTALRGHLQALRERQEELNAMIETVTETIRAAEQEETMTDEAKFAAFRRREVEENEEKYGAEARKKYGDETMDQANARRLNLTREQYQEYTALEEEIRQRLEGAVRSGADPKGEEGKELTRLHRRWLEFSLGKSYTPAVHRGIAQMYTADERFTAYYDLTVLGCAQFLRKAVETWVKEKE